MPAVATPCDAPSHCSSMSLTASSVRSLRHGPADRVLLFPNAALSHNTA